MQPGSIALVCVWLQMHLCQCVSCAKLTVVLIMMKHPGFAAERWQLPLAIQYLQISDKRSTLANAHSEAK